MPLRALAVVAMALLPLSAAWAYPGDPIEFFISETVIHDSNLFRISRDRDSLTFLGNADRSDTRAITAAGFTFDIPLGRQRFLGEVSLNDNHYEHFSELNHTGRMVRALWQSPQDGPMHGQLGYLDSEAVSSFSTIQARASNLLTTRRVYGGGVWQFASAWELQADLADQTQRNDTSLRHIDDLDFSSGELRLNLIVADDSRVGLSVRVDDGAFPHSGADNDFHQSSVGVVADWSPTAKSRLNLRLDHVRRSFDQPFRETFEGATMRLTYEAQLTERFSLNTVAQRDFSPVEDISTSGVLIKGLAVQPRFNVTEKLQLGATIDFSSRDYVGVVTRRTDHLRILAASMSYRPIERLLLSMIFQREVRTSNIQYADYAASAFNVGARLSF